MTLSERVTYPNYYHFDYIRSIVQEYVVTWHITCLSARKMCHCDIIVVYRAPLYGHYGGERKDERRCGGGRGIPWDE